MIKVGQVRLTESQLGREVHPEFRFREISRHRTEDCDPVGQGVLAERTIERRLAEASIRVAIVVNRYAVPRCKLIEHLHV